MTVRYAKPALKFLGKQDQHSVERIKAAIQGLMLSDPAGNIKIMQGCDDGRKRLRVNGWRIIYKYGIEKESKVLYIMDIGNRGDIYK